MPAKTLADLVAADPKAQTFQTTQRTLESLGAPRAVRERVQGQAQAHLDTLSARFTNANTPKDKTPDQLARETLANIRRQDTVARQHFTSTKTAFFTDEQGRVRPITSPEGNKLVKKDNSGVLHDTMTGKAYRMVGNQLVDAWSGVEVTQKKKDGLIIEAPKGGGLPPRAVGVDEANPPGFKEAKQTIAAAGTQIEQAATFARERMTEQSRRVTNAKEALRNAKTVAEERFLASKIDDPKQDPDLLKSQQEVTAAQTELVNRQLEVERAQAEERKFLTEKPARIESERKRLVAEALTRLPGTGNKASVGNIQLQEVPAKPAVPTVSTDVTAPLAAVQAAATAAPPPSPSPASPPPSQRLAARDFFGREIAKPTTPTASPEAVGVPTSVGSVESPVGQAPRLPQSSPQQAVPAPQPAQRLNLPKGTTFHGATTVPATYLTPEARTAQAEAQATGQAQFTASPGIRLEGRRVLQTSAPMPGTTQTIDVDVGRMVFDEHGLPSLVLSHPGSAYRSTEGQFTIAGTSLDGDVTSPSFKSGNYFRGIPEYAAPPVIFRDQLQQGSEETSRFADGEAEDEDLAQRERDARMMGRKPRGAKPTDASGMTPEQAMQAGTVTPEEVDAAWQARRWPAAKLNDYLQQWQAGTDADRANLVADMDPSQEQLAPADRRIDARRLWESGFISLQDARLLQKVAYGIEPDRPSLKDAWSARPDAQTADLATRQAFATEYFRLNRDLVDFSNAGFTTDRDAIMQADPGQGAGQWMKSSSANALGSSAGMLVGMPINIIGAGVRTVKSQLKDDMSPEEKAALELDAQRLEAIVGQTGDSAFNLYAHVRERVRQLGGHASRFDEMRQDVSNILSAVDSGKQFTPEAFRSLRQRIMDRAAEVNSALDATYTKEDLGSVYDVGNLETRAGRVLAEYMETRNPSLKDALIAELLANPLEMSRREGAAALAGPPLDPARTAFWDQVVASYKGGAVAPLTEAGVEYASTMLTFGASRMLGLARSAGVQGARAGAVASRLEEAWKTLGVIAEPKTLLARASNMAVTGAKIATIASLTEGGEEVVAAYQQKDATTQDAMEQGLQGAFGGLTLMPVFAAPNAAISGVRMATTALEQRAQRQQQEAALARLVETHNTHNPDRPIDLETARQARGYLSRAHTVSSELAQQATAAMQAVAALPEGPERDAAFSKANDLWMAAFNDQFQQEADAIAAVQEINGLSDQGPEGAALRNVIDAALRAQAGAPLTPEQEGWLSTYTTPDGKPVAYRHGTSPQSVSTPASGAAPSTSEASQPATPQGVRLNQRSASTSPWIFTDAFRQALDEAAPQTGAQYFATPENDQIELVDRQKLLVDAKRSGGSRAPTAATAAGQNTTATLAPDGSVPPQPSQAQGGPVPTGTHNPSAAGSTPAPATPIGPQHKVGDQVTFRLPNRPDPIQGQVEEIFDKDGTARVSWKEGGNTLGNTFKLDALTPASEPSVGQAPRLPQSSPQQAVPAPQPAAGYQFSVTYTPKVGGQGQVSATIPLPQARTPEAAETMRTAKLRALERSATNIQAGPIEAVQASDTGVPPVSAPGVSPEGSGAPTSANPAVAAALASGTDGTINPNAPIERPKGTEAWKPHVLTSLLRNLAQTFGYKLADTGIRSPFVDSWGKPLNWGTNLFDKLQEAPFGTKAAEIGHWIDNIRNSGATAAIKEGMTQPWFHRVWFGHDFATNLGAVVDKFGPAAIPDYMLALLKDSTTRAGLPLPGVQALVHSGAVSDSTATAWLSLNLPEAFAGGLSILGTWRLHKDAKAGKLGNSKLRVITAILGVGFKLIGGSLTAQPLLILSGLADTAILVTRLGDIKKAFQRLTASDTGVSGEAAVGQALRLPQSSPQPGSAVSTSPASAGSQPAAPTGGASQQALAPPQPADPAAAWRSARQRALKKFKVTRDKAAAYKAIQFLENELALFAPLFSGGYLLADENHHFDDGTATGITFDPGDSVAAHRLADGRIALLIDLDGWTAFRNDSKPSLRATLLEELYHRAALDTFKPGEMADVWYRIVNEAPDLAKTVWLAYHHVAAHRAGVTPESLAGRSLEDLDAIAPSDPESMGHELLRMLLQDRQKRSAITEALGYSPGLLATLKQFLERLAESLRALVAQAPPKLRTDIQRRLSLVQSTLADIVAQAPSKASRTVVPEFKTGPIEPTPSQPGTKNQEPRTFSGPSKIITPNPAGFPDILDWISARHRIRRPYTKAEIARRKAEGQDIGGEWDWTERHPLDFYHRQVLLGGEGNDTIDSVAQTAFEEGLIAQPTADALGEAITGAIDARKALTAQQDAQDRNMAEAERQALDFGRHTAPTAHRQPVDTNELHVGDEVEVDGEKLKVTDLDPDTGEVTLKDGSRFGRQTVAEGQTLYVESYNPKARTAKPAPLDATPFAARRRINDAQPELGGEVSSMFQLGGQRPPTRPVGQAPRLPSGPPPTPAQIKAAEAVATRLKRLQKERTLTSIEQQALENAERTLGQGFMFEDVRSLAPAQNLTLRAAPRRLERPPVNIDFSPRDTTLAQDEQLSSSDGSNASVIASIRRAVGRGLPADAALRGPAADTGVSGQVLRRWAQANGRLLDNDAFHARVSQAKPITGGEEHDVFLDAATGRVIKITVPGKYGAKGLEAWLHNIERSNEVFGDDIQILGVLEYSPGTVQLVLSQPFVAGAKPGTWSKIAYHMATLGYRQVTDLSFYHTDREEQISDAQEKNILEGEDGQIYPIDVHFLEPSDGAKDRFTNTIYNNIYPNPLDGPNPITASGPLKAASRRLDAQYASAVKKGDLEAAQKMVNQVARQNGYDVDRPLYHHGAAEITEFHMDVGNPADQGPAGTYLSPDPDRFGGFNKGGQYKLYARFENPAKLDTPLTRRHIEEAKKQLGNESPSEEAPARWTRWLASLEQQHLYNLEAARQRQNGGKPDPDRAARLDRQMEALDALLNVPNLPPGEGVNIEDLHFIKNYSPDIFRNIEFYDHLRRRTTTPAEAADVDSRSPRLLSYAKDIVGEQLTKDRLEALTGRAAPESRQVKAPPPVPGSTPPPKMPSVLPDGSTVLQNTETEIAKVKKLLTWDKQPMDEPLPFGLLSFMELAYYGTASMSMHGESVLGSGERYWFGRPGEGMTLEQKADLKRRARTFFESQGFDAVDKVGRLNPDFVGWDMPGFSDWGEVVAFRPSQVKYASTITRDADGNIIPPSQRFNTSNPSILRAAHRSLETVGVPPLGGISRISPDQRAHEAATSPFNTRPEPTDAQKKAGNYKLGHARIAGLDLSIENPAGSTRRGTDKGGKPWSITMQDHYGYFKGSKGKDKDHVDVFVAPGTPRDYEGPVYVVNQRRADGTEFDEHKVILGASTPQEAQSRYLSNYSPGWKGLGSIATFPTVDSFKSWLADDTTRPAVSPSWNPLDTLRAAPRSPSNPVHSVHTSPSLGLPTTTTTEQARIQREANLRRQTLTDISRGELDRRASEHGGFFADIRGFIMNVFAGRYDKLEYYAPGVRRAIEDNNFSEAYARAAISRMMANVTRDLRAAFGDPRFWSAQQKRLNTFLDQLLPVAARLEVDGMDAQGNWTFKPFQMRAATIPLQAMDYHGYQEGQRIAWTNRQGENESFEIGPKIPDRNAHVLLRDMPSDLQAQIYQDFITQFPEGTAVLDQFINPDLRDATFTGPGNVTTAVFNRYALLKEFNDWPQELRDLFGRTPLAQLTGISGYTPDVAAQKTVAAFVSSLLNRYQSGARQFKAGELRESGNIKNLLDGFSTRAMEAHREKIRAKTRRDLIDRASRRLSDVPPGTEDQYVPLDDTFTKLYEAVVIGRNLPRNAYPALAEALNPAQRQILSSIVGDLYRLRGNGLVIHKAVQQELMVSMAMERTENTFLKVLEWFLDRTTKGFLGLSSYAVNWSSNEILKLMAIMNRFNFAVVSGLTGDPAAAKLGAYEFSHLLRGFFSDRLARWQSRITDSIPEELLADNSGMAALEDPNDLTALDSLFGFDPNSPMGILARHFTNTGRRRSAAVAGALARRLDPGGAFLKAIGYGNVDVNPKVSMIYRMLRARGAVLADQQGLRPGNPARASFIADFVLNAHQAHPEAFREAYRQAMFWYMDYANVPSFLDPSQSLGQGSRVLKKGLFPFLKWGFNMIRQAKAMTVGAAADLVLPGSTGTQRREAAAKLMTMVGLTALGAVLTGDDDDPVVGTNVDEQGKLLDEAYRTGNRLNVSRIARMVQQWAAQYGVPLPKSDYTVEGTDDTPADIWVRYRNFPYLREMVMLGLAANGKWETMWEQAAEMTSEYASFGMFTKLFPVVYQLSPFDRDKSYPYVATEAMYNILSSPILPKHARDVALGLTDPVQRRNKKLESWNYFPGAMEAIMANTPGLSQYLPPSGSPTTARIAPFIPAEWFNSQLAKIQNDKSLTPDQRRDAMAALTQEFKDVPRLSPAEQRKILTEWGVPSTAWQPGATSTVPVASQLQELTQLGIGQNAVRQVQTTRKNNRTGTTTTTPSISYIPPSSISINPRNLQMMKQFTGINAKPVNRRLTTAEMFRK